MARYFRYVGNYADNNQLIAGIWGNADENPCPTSYVPQPAVLNALTNGGIPKGVLQGTQPLFAGTFPESCYDYYEGVTPPPLVDTLANRDVKAKTSYKSFKEAQKNGKIVLRPRDVLKAHVVRHPGFNLHSAPPVGGLLTRGRSLQVETAPGTAPSCSGPTTYGNRLVSIEGFPPDTPMTVGSRHIGMMYLAWSQHNVGDGDFYHPSWDDVNGLWSQILELVDAPYDRGLITRAVAEANSGTFDLLTELGEMKETIGFVFGLLKSIINLVIKTRRAALQIPKQPGKSMAQIADELASLWMQFRYAVMPITYTIDDAIDTIATIVGEYKTFRQGAQTDTPVSFNGWTTSSPVQTIDRVYIKYRMDLDVALGGLKTNPFSTAWELTPLSFVVDWVLNVGDLLSALYTPSEVIDSGFQYSRQIRQTVLTFTRPEYTGRIELHLGHYRARSFQPIDHFGLQIDLEMTWKRWLDALSLSWLLSTSKLKSK